MTVCPACDSEWTPAGVNATRRSSFQLSLGIPTIIGSSLSANKIFL